MFWAMLKYVHDIYKLNKDRTLYALGVTGESERIMNNLPIQPLPSYALNPVYVNTVVPGWDTVTKVIKVVLTPLAYISSWFSSPVKNEPPSAPGHTILGSLPELKAMNWDVLNFLVAYHRKYGSEDGISEVTLVNKTFYIISDPVKAKKILLGKL